MQSQSLSVLLLLFMAILGPNSHAAEPRLSLGRQDYTWMLASAVVTVSAQIRYQKMPSVDTNALDRLDLNIMDRWVAGTYSPAAAKASDILVLPFCALPMGLVAWDAWRGEKGLSPIWTEGVIFTEAIVLSSGIDLLVRSLQIHPRPLVYGKDVPAKERLSGEASGSFYSGHSSAAFLTAVYLSYTYPMRHPDFQGQAWLWAGTLTTASAVAGLRVAAGKHFPSDVIVGALAGGFLGWLLPYMHTQNHNSVPSMGMQLDDLGFHPQIAWTF